MSTESAFDASEIYSWIERQASLGPRRPGSPAGRANELWLASMLQSFGLKDVRQEPIPITRWEAQEAALAIAAGGDFDTVECFPIPYTAFTPQAGLEARLAFADSGRLLQPGDWRGAIVVAEIGFPELDAQLLLKVSAGAYDPEGSLESVRHPATWVRLGWHLYRLAAKRGAAGFVGVVRDQPGGSCRMYAPYGFKEKDILDKPIPGLWIGRADGKKVLEAARSGRARGRIRLLGKGEQAVTHNLVGECPGESEEAIVLSCHHDSPFDSPVEDASGVAVVLSLARHFAAQRRLKRRLVVLLTAGHFYGSVGTRTFIREHRSDIVKNTVLEISIEHIALEAGEDEQGRLVPTGLPEATGIFVPFNKRITAAVLDSVSSRDLRRVLLLPAEGPLGDYPPTDGGDWYEAGIPVINCICNPVYLLTAEDSIEWVARGRLSVVAETFADIIGRLDALPRRELAAVDSRGRRLLMRALKHVARARTTCFGLKPVY